MHHTVPRLIPVLSVSMRVRIMPEILRQNILMIPLTIMDRTICSCIENRVPDSILPRFNRPCRWENRRISELPTRVALTGSNSEGKM